MPRTTKSEVYFTPASDSDDIRATCEKLKRLLERSAVLDAVRKGYEVAAKIHFGEEGNAGFVRPEYAGVVCDFIAAKGATAFLADTNTLYRGKRTNSRDHLAVAGKHGFTKEATGARIVIPDDADRNSTVGVKMNGERIKTAKLARLFIDADAIIAINHFKGHIMTGFGGALKNIGMGCATREGKLAQHCDASPVVYADKCKACGACVKICPADAIRIEEKRAVVDISKCIGCANCIAACPTNAMFIDMKSGLAVQEKMVEYAAAALKGKKGRAGFLNFAVRIKKECDCWGEDTPTLAPDVGILASTDPVAIDKASFDLVEKVCGYDVFKEAHPDGDGMIQLRYAARIGLGALDYELIEIR